MKTILYSPGDPAGIGTDLLLELVNNKFFDTLQTRIVCLADPNLLQARASMLGFDNDFQKLCAWHMLPESQDCIESCPDTTAGKLNPQNASYIMQVLNFGIQQCMEHSDFALVTGPISKENIIEGGISFSGHTEYIQEQTKSADVLMLLASERIRVALATTHIPLRKVADHISQELIVSKVTILFEELQQKFGIVHPQITVLGLNPHAGEGGKLGTEEQDIIIPAIQTLQQQGITVKGPLSADTAFSKDLLDSTDAYLAMFHDQGLPVLKTLSFGDSINITLGVPIIRTSVDHGVALDIVGQRVANPSSLKNAFIIANELLG